MSRSRKPGGRKARGARSAQKQSVNIELSQQARFAATLAVAGLFIWGLYSIAKVDPHNNSVSANPQKNHSQRDTASTVVQENSDSNEYTFYSRLKDFKIEVPEFTPSSKSGNDAAPISYLIQAGSFRTSQQAETRRAELTLLGLEPRVEKNINSRSELWYRIMLGPFTSRSEMAGARSKLISNRYEALVMKRKG